MNEFVAVPSPRAARARRCRIARAFLARSDRRDGPAFQALWPISALVVGARTSVVSTERDVTGTVFVYWPELNRDLLTNHADFTSAGCLVRCTCASRSARASGR
jgi:hypothetical protein